MSFDFKEEYKGSSGGGDDDLFAHDARTAKYTQKHEPRAVGKWTQNESQLNENR